MRRVEMNRSDVQLGVPVESTKCCGSGMSVKAYRRRSLSFPSKELLWVQHKDMSPLPKRLCGESSYSAYTTFTQDTKHANLSIQYNGNDNIANQNNNNNTNSQQRTRYKKRKLGVSLSCPPIFSKCQMGAKVAPSPTCTASVQHASSAHNSSYAFTTPTPAHKHDHHTPTSKDNKYPILNMPSGSKSRHNGRNVITCQPGSADYIAFIKQTEDVHDSAIKYIDSLSGDTRCVDCLRTTQNIVSWCTCHFCLMGACYHCVDKDDVGCTSKSKQWKHYMCCRGSAQQNIRRTAIMVSCLPCMPCLSLYPLLNTILKLCIKCS